MRSCTHQCRSARLTHYITLIPIGCPDLTGVPVQGIPFLPLDHIMALGIVIHRDRYLLGRPRSASSAAYTVDRSKNLLKTKWCIQFLVLYHLSHTFTSGIFTYWEARIDTQQFNIDYTTNLSSTRLIQCSHCASSSRRRRQGCGKGPAGKSAAGVFVLVHRKNLRKLATPVSFFGT